MNKAAQIRPKSLCLVFSIIFLILSYLLNPIISLASTDVPITVTSIDITSVKEGNKAIVQINGKNIVDNNNLKVSLGGTDLRISFKSSKYIRVVVPETIPAGSYEIEITNGNGIKTNAGIFTVIGKTIPKPDFYADITEIMEGTEVFVHIKDRNGLCSSDMALFLGDLEMRRTFLHNTYGRFYVPSTVREGVYDIKVINKNEEYKLGYFTVKKNPPPPPPVFSTNLTKSKEGETVILEVYIKNDIFVNGAELYFDNIHIRRTFLSNEYCRFVVPNTLTSKEYLMKVVNRDDSFEIGSFKIMPKDTPPDPVFGKMDVNKSEEGMEQVVVLEASSKNIYSKDFALFLTDIPITDYTINSTTIVFTVPDTVPTGLYTLKALNALSYFDIGTYEVLPPPPEPKFMSITPNSNLEGKEEIVVIAGDNANIYAKDLSVYLDDLELQIVGISNKDIISIIPASIPAGKYNIRVYNRKKFIDVSPYEITVPPPLPFMISNPQITKTSTQVGTAISIEVRSDKVIQYGDINSFKVRFNDIIMTSISPQQKYCRINIPATLPVGTYTIIFENSDGPREIGTFVVNPLPQQSYNKLQEEEHKMGDVIQIGGKNLRFASDYTVTIKGVVARPSFKSATYIRVVVPAGLPIGEICPIVVSNDGEVFDLGTIKIIG